jgi:hypothetical protein
MTLRLTERDHRMLAKCAVCRWLTTDQLRRLYFPTATPNAVQKRLRKLAEAGYLRTHQENPTAEAIHAVGPKGKPLVEEKGISAALDGEIPRQIEHLRGVNDIRIAIESGTVPTAYFFAYWQLSNLGWPYPMIPDAVVAVREPLRRTFLAEYDRGTETLEKLLAKLEWYGHGLEEFRFEAVLVVTERTRRLDVLARDLRRNDVPVTVLTSTLEEIKEGDFFAVSFVDLQDGRKRTVLEVHSPEGED